MRAGQRSPSHLKDKTRRTDASPSSRSKEAPCAEVLDLLGADELRELLVDGDGAPHVRGFLAASSSARNLAISSSGQRRVRVPIVTGAGILPSRTHS